MMNWPQFLDRADDWAVGFLTGAAAISVIVFAGAAVLFERRPAQPSPARWETDRLQTQRWRELDSNHRSRGIGGRFERNAGDGAWRRANSGLPAISDGILSLHKVVKRWMGGQSFEPIRSPDTVGATSRMKHSIDWRSWSRLRLPWKLI